MRTLHLLTLIFLLALFSFGQTTSPYPSSSSSQTSSTAAGQYQLPTGSKIDVRVNESLSSETSQQGDRFTGTVESEVVDPSSGRTVIPRGAQVTGRVLSATPSGRLSDSGELQLSINTIRAGSSMVNVTVQPFVVQGESHTKSNTTKVGGGAALGAIIGAIAGGGKGAAIGAGVGGAAGAGAAAATGKRPAEVKPEALVTFVTAAQINVPVAMAQATPLSATTSSSTNSSSSTSSPFPSSPSTSPYPSQSSTDSSTSDSIPSSTSSDTPPVLQRRDGSTANPTTSTTNSAASPNTSSSSPSPASSATPGNAGTSSAGGYGSPTTPNATGSTSPSSASGSGGMSSTGTATTGTLPSSPYPSTTGTSTSSPYPPPTGSASTASSQVLTGRSFTARDRRVINNCVREHGSSLPDAALHKSGAATTTFATGDIIPAGTNRLLRSLPLPCDRELPALSNDLERVIYGGQVMLIDSSSRVLDVFALTP